ncbi:hypothetical protein LAZ67_3000731, partial [Cordylochernes scorpioides]
MLNELENNPDFLDNVVTGDESWTFQYDPEMKAQSSEWHTPASPRPKKARMSKSRVKTMLIVFFDKRQEIHKEFVLQGKTVNAEFYKEVLRRLHKAVKRKRQDLAQRWRLHHDNAPAHTAFLPPYSPDMSPPDFFLFPKVKRCLRGHRFDDIPNIQRAVTKALTGITPTDYSGAYEAWKTRWQRCVDAQGEFFEDYKRFDNVLRGSCENLAPYNFTTGKQGTGNVRASEPGLLEDSWEEEITGDAAVLGSLIAGA